MTSLRWPAFLRTLTAALVALVATFATRPAEAQIKSPGAHNDYSVELEPHLIWQYGATEHLDSDGFGIGLRSSIPVLRNGPVTTINNNLAVTFGFDWTHFDEDCGGGVINGFNASVDCTANHFLVPIALQWNFFFTPSISGLVELGLGIHHYDEKVECDVNVPIVRGVNCDGFYDNNHTNVIPVFGVGPRFQLSDLFAITIRVGYPYMTLGGSFFL